jgi:hypothetical protein
VTSRISGDQPRQDVGDRNLKGIDAEPTVADIRDLAAVRAACRGARFVFHLAAIYRFWARDPRIFYDVNVGGTLNVLDAILAAGCERLVFTSTAGVLGLDSTKHGKPADETSPANISHLFGHYKRSKFIAEHAGLRTAWRPRMPSSDPRGSAARPDDSRPGGATKPPSGWRRSCCDVALAFLRRNGQSAGFSRESRYTSAKSLTVRSGSGTCPPRKRAPQATCAQCSTIPVTSLARMPGE